MKYQVIIHHTAVSRTKNERQFDAVKRYHIGKGWGDIGYHFLIEPDGEVRRGRHTSAEGAHCRGQNHMLGIALTGHFDQEDPTDAQMAALRHLLLSLSEAAGRNLKIYPHRQFATKTCPGTRFTDAMLADLPRGVSGVSEWAKDGARYLAERGIMTKWDTPQSPVTKEVLATVLGRLFRT